MSEVPAETRTSAVPAWHNRRVPPDVRRKSRELDTDATVGFALFLTMLFMPQLNTAGAAFFSLVATGYIAARSRQIRAIIVPRAFLLATGGLAFLSAAWSEQPMMTLKYSLELSLTIVASLILSSAPQPKRVIEALFLACALHSLASLALGQTVPMGDNGGTAFAGLNGSKNMLAESSGEGFLSAMAVFFIGVEDGKFWRCAAAGLVAAIQLETLLSARSTGGTVTVAATAAAFLLFLSLRKTVFPVRATLLGVIGFCLAFAALAYVAVSDIVADVVLRYLDKDATFTGRTYLWQRAGDLIAEKPLLGKGFHAFWFQGNPDADGLARFLDFKVVEGTNFHNNFIELLVSFGWIGLIFFMLSLLVALAFLVLRFIRYPDLAVCFWLSVAVYSCARMPIESIVPGEFGLSTVILWIGLGSAFRRAPDRSLRPRGTLYH